MKNLALLGNPNVGKTTLFNTLTGSNQRVGNWAGVTVDKKEGSFNDYNIIVVERERKERRVTNRQNIWCYIPEKIETVEETAGGKNITYVYEYNGYTFTVEAEVDAVQTHNAEAAIKSAWGVSVVVSENGNLSLQ